MDNRIKHIVDYYGFTSQVDMLIEESAEFIQAVSKFRRGYNDEYSHIKEELADIIVCAEQLRYLLGADEIDGIVDSKLDRQLERIAKEKQND